MVSNLPPDTDTGVQVEFNETGLTLSFSLTKAGCKDRADFHCHALFLDHYVVGRNDTLSASVTAQSRFLVLPAGL